MGSQRDAQDRQLLVGLKPPEAPGASIISCYQQLRRGKRALANELVYRADADGRPESGRVGADRLGAPSRSVPESER